MQPEGLITVPSAHSVKETLDKLEVLLDSKGIKVFTRIDQAAEAERAGLQMAPTELLIFGNPKGGTPLMVAQPLSAIDLPLKALAWQDANGRVWLSYNDSAYLQKRFGINEDVMKPIAGATALIELAGQ